MSSNLKVNTILPSTGTTIGIGTVGGLINVVGNIDVNSTSGISTFNGLEISGIVTAKAGAAVTYYGDGSNLTSLPAQATIANNADNRVITGGSGVNLNGEANFVFDGTNLGVGQPNPENNSNFTTLTLNHATNGGVLSFQKNGSRKALLYNDTSTGDLVIQSEASRDLRFYTNGGNERVRITSDGKMGLGTSSVDELLHVANTGGGASILIETNASSGGNILFGDNSSNTVGRVQYVHSDNSMRFYTNGTERLRIDSSGNMNFQNSSTSATTALSSIIFNNGGGEVARIRGETRNGNTNGMITFFTDISGTLSEKMRVNHDGAFCFGTDSARTAEFSQPEGFSIRFDDKGQFQNSVSNTTGGYMNRKGSDGGILSFARQGTYVGEIGVNSSSIYLNFGGTNATAHQLDDYEEGSWTPAVQFDVGGSGVSYGTRSGTYVKIGRMVHLQYYMVISSGLSSSDYFCRLSLPFTGIGVGHQDARVRQWNTAHSDWFLSLGGAGPVFFHSNAMGSGANYARGDDVNGHVLSGQYTLYVS